MDNFFNGENKNIENENNINENEKSDISIEELMEKVSAQTNELLTFAENTEASDKAVGNNSENAYSYDEPLSEIEADSNSSSQPNIVDSVNEAPASEKAAFYKEVVTKKPKTSKILIASVLSAGLMFGTIFGFTIDNFVLDNNKQANTAAASTISSLPPTKVVDNTSEQTIEWIAEKVSPAVVSVQTKAVVNNYFFGNIESDGIGSGVLISSDGMIVTNNHVINGANSITVVLSDGKKYTAKLINTDPAYDLAVIKIDATNLPFAEFGDSDAVKVGELAVAIGNPVAEEYAGTVTAGIISGVNRQYENQGKKLSLLQTDAAINPGNSGGALVDSDGKVIGINTLKLVETQVEGMGFAIPSNEVKTVVDELIKNPMQEKPMLGISGRSVTQEEAQQYKVPQGVLVAGVASLSGAERAGIRQGEIITGIDGKKIQTMEELIAEIGKHKVGDVVKLDVYDQLDRTTTVDVKLSSSATVNSATTTQQ